MSGSHPLTSFFLGRTDQRTEILTGDPKSGVRRKSGVTGVCVCVCVGGFQTVISTNEHKVNIYTRKWGHLGVWGVYVGEFRKLNEHKLIYSDTKKKKNPEMFN